MSLLGKFQRNSRVKLKTLKSLVSELKGDGPDDHWLKDGMAFFNPFSTQDLRTDNRRRDGKRRRYPRELLLYRRHDTYQNGRRIKCWEFAKGTQRRHYHN